jgi:hypothetical protein
VLHVHFKVGETLANILQRVNRSYGLNYTNIYLSDKTTGNIDFSQELPIDGSAAQFSNGMKQPTQYGFKPSRGIKDNGFSRK